MKKKLFLLSAACLILGACEMDKSEAPATDRTAAPMENETDRGLTQKIRQVLMDDDSLSTHAKNIKIITLNGVVTLRGPVDSEREKSEVGKKAKAIIGVRSVDNQTEVLILEKVPGQEANKPMENK
jgi:hyperosmotically inducible protein